MVFSSVLFTFAFLPIVTLIYFISKDIFKNYILLAVSILFYSYGEPKFVFLMILSILLNFFIAIGISFFKNNKSLRFLLLLVDIIGNLSILYIFKYFNFSISIINNFFKANLHFYDIKLPIGISFFTFQALSYVVDVYKGKVKVQKNPFYIALYISFFPQLIAGPIVRYSSIAEQIEYRTINIEKFGDGTKRFILGFCKKVILANNLALVAEEVFKINDFFGANAIYLWLGSICYSLQIFYDFSGYSDMAIGLGKMFGFEFEENFNYPYISKTITEFWRRWHISLGQWFRDYIYIPLGGVKVSPLKHIFNLFIVWFLTGLWHGANYTFIGWGLGYFVLLVAEKYIIKPDKRKTKVLKVCWQIITLLSINFGWVVFNSPYLKFGIQYCLSMVGYYNNIFVIDEKVFHLLSQYGFYIISGILFSTPILKLCEQKLDKNIKILKLKIFIFPLCYIMIFLWAVSFLLLGAHNPFIYFNF